MKFSEMLDSYIDGAFNGSEVELAVAEFTRHIPSRILHMEFDADRSNKQGVKVGNRVYKLGLDKANNRVYIEYLDDPNQAKPSMTLTVDKNMPAVVVDGWQVDKRMQVAFTVRNGRVHKSVKTN